MIFDVWRKPWEVKRLCGERGRSGRAPLAETYATGMPLCDVEARALKRDMTQQHFCLRLYVRLSGSLLCRRGAMNGKRPRYPSGPVKLQLEESR